MREPGQNRPCNADDTHQLRRTRRVHQAGFTLIELLLVVAILLILTTLYWSGGSNAQERQKKNCEANLLKIHLAMEIYANDNAGRFPVAPGAHTSEEALDVLVPRYTSDTSIFICPTGRDPELPSGESIRKLKISYAYFMGRSLSNADEIVMSDRLLDTRPKAAGEMAFSENGKPPGNNHRGNGGNFLFVDGHVAASPPRLPFSLVLPQGIVLLNPKP